MGALEDLSPAELRRLAQERLQQLKVCVSNSSEHRNLTLRFVPRRRREPASNVKPLRRAMTWPPLVPTRFKNVKAAA